MKKLEKVLWGVILIVVGGILCLNASGVTDIDIFFDGWWTLFIIIPCAFNLITDDHKFGSLIGLGIGVLLLLNSNDIIDIGDAWKFIIPAILILFGLKLLLGDTFSKHKLPVDSEINEEHKYYASFSGKDLDYSGRKVENMELTATFGGIKLDLREAKLDKETVVKVSAVFGGIDIYIPSDVVVVDKTNSIFGGVDTKRCRKNSGKKTLYITGGAVFGGVEIK